MGRRVVSAGVRDRRSDRDKGDRRYRRSRLRGPLEAVYPQPGRKQIGLADTCARLGCRGLARALCYACSIMAKTLKAGAKRRVRDIREIAQRELRNDISRVLAAVERGAR